MSNTRQSFSLEFKAKIALLAISETMTLGEICSKYEVHATQVGKWKKELQERSSELFSRPNKKDMRLAEKEQELDRTYKQIGQLTIEVDWLKKIYRSWHLALDKLGLTIDIQHFL